MKLKNKEKDTRIRELLVAAAAFLRPDTQHLQVYNVVLVVSDTHIEVRVNDALLQANSQDLQDKYFPIGTCWSAAHSPEESMPLT